MASQSPKLRMNHDDRTMGENRRYREIEVTGSPRDLGRQLGEAAKTEIRGFVEIALSRVNKTIAVSRKRALWVAAKSAEYAERYSSEMMEELRGIAESSGVALDDLMLLQVRNQLRSEPEAGCTSASIATSKINRSPILAQNWDNDPALDPYTIVLTRRPTGKPAFMNITQAGLIAYIGFSEVGLGVCLNTLPAPSKETGVPHYFTVRGIYEANSLEGAVTAVRRAERAIPANIMMASPQGPADLEVTLDSVQVLTDLRGVVTHANHCLHPDLKVHNDSFPELIQSYPRQQRIDQLFYDRGLDVKQVMAALADHDGYPRSICRHPNDDPKTGEWQTVFSVVIEPAEQRMHVSRGTPCDHPYESYSLK